MQAQQRPPAVSSSFRGRLRLRSADGALDPRIDTRWELLESGVSELTRPGEGEHRVAPGPGTPRRVDQGAHQAPCRWVSGMRSSPPSSVETTTSTLVMRTGG